MKIEITVPTSRIYDTIFTGLEGGIRYWARVEFCRASARALASDEHGLEVVCELAVIDTGERLTLRDQWATGLRLMAERHPQHFAALVAGTGDLVTGDVLIQLAAFGKLVYG